MVVIFIKPFFEYIDTLNSPYEAFYFDASKEIFPILPHWHYFIEIIYMIKGNVFIEVGNSNYVLEAGDLILIPPEKKHTIYSTGKLSICYGVLKFNPSHLNLLNSSLPKISNILQMIFEDKKNKLHFTKNEIKHINMKNLFEKCINIVNNKNFGYDILAHSYYCIIITELIKIWTNNGFSINKKTTISKTSDLISEIIEYINNNINSDLKVSELASKCNMSYSYFAKEFKNFCGKSCKDYILFSRLSKSKDLLKFTDYDLNYISQECGFNDCSHFIKSFKNYYKITPNKYRMNSK